MKKYLFIFITAFQFSSIASAQPGSRLEMYFSAGRVFNAGQPAQPNNIIYTGFSTYSTSTYYGFREEIQSLSPQIGIIYSAPFMNIDRVSLALGVQYLTTGSTVMADSLVVTTQQLIPFSNSLTKQVTENLVWSVKQSQLHFPIRLRYYVLKKEKHRIYFDVSVLAYRYLKGKYPEGINVNSDEVTGKFNVGFEGGLGYTSLYNFDKYRLLTSAGFTALRMGKSGSGLQQMQFIGVRLSAGIEWKRSE